LDAEKIRIEISQTASPEFGQALRAENWTSTFLADFIVQNHHTFIRKATPELEALLEKVCERHGAENVELLQIREYFQELAEELRTHMEKEEFVLFPAIKRLEAQQGQNHPMEKMIQTPIEAMEDEHQIAGDLLKQIRILSNNYTPTDYACPTFRITFQKLKEFDNDLMRHIHLENNILFERFKNLAPMASCNL
jgi:regulator of cell morphogenesis and NO signaling